MKEQNEQMIWKYLDGHSSPAECEAMEKRLAEDAAFRAAFLERQRLHAALQEQEAEQPSLRFAKNVMDRLPALYRRSVEPLVRPFWTKVFAGALGAFLILYFGGVIYSVERGLVSGEGPAAEVGNQVSTWLDRLPPHALYIVLALSISYLFLVFLDRKLQQKMLGEGKGHEWS